MRTIKKLLFLLILSVLLFSCEDLKDNILKKMKNETTTTVVPSKTHFTAKVNGVLLDLSAGNTSSAQK